MKLILTITKITVATIAIGAILHHWLTPTKPEEKELPVEDYENFLR